MFLFNWFRHSSPIENDDTRKCTMTTTVKIVNNPEMCIIQKDEYDALLKRLRNLEEMMNALPMKHETPVPPPPPTKPIVCEQKSYFTPFQLELETKIKSIREKMGESHGFGMDLTLNNIDDLDKLEHSVMIQSMSIHKQEETPRKATYDEIVTL